MATGKTVDPVANLLAACVTGYSAVSASTASTKAAETLQAVLNSSRVDVEPQMLPAVQRLEEHRGLVDPAFSAARHLFRWNPTPRSDDGGKLLALAAVSEMFDTSHTVGLMVVSADAEYPLHQHQPHECYLVISGVGRWRFGDNPRHCRIRPGSTLYNRPYDCHGVIADSQPIVAMYVLWD